MSDLGPHTDVYALGAVLYKLLTGRVPFEGKSVQETLCQLCAEEPVAPHLLQPEVPREISEICLRCLAKEPRGRFGSAKRLAEALRDVGGRAPDPAAPPATGR